MVIKRKRNLKIDVTTNYSVFLLRDLIQEELEDYVENRDTGMEAEEEKEIHLQNVIKGTGKEIPLPVIVEVENPSRAFYDKKKFKEKIFWEKDCGNEYVETKDDLEAEKEMLLKIKEEPKKEIPQAKESSFFSIDTLSLFSSVFEKKEENQNRVLESSQSAETKDHSADKSPICFKEIIKRIGNEKNTAIAKNEDISNFCLRKTLLRYEKPGYETYICFRDRIFNPTFKSRRNEVLMFEKINRMGTEFNTIKVLCQLYREKCEKEYEMYKRTSKIIKKILESNMSRKKRSLLVKLMFTSVDRTVAARNRANIEDLMVDRQKIITMRSMKSSNELFLDIKYYNEIMNMIRSHEDDVSTKFGDHKDKDVD